MEKQEVEKLYNELGWRKIDDLYHYSCLLTSGFDKEKAYNLMSLLNDLWLKDENNYGISKLSDMLYNVYKDIEDNIGEMTTREILAEMYDREYYSSSDDECIEN